MQASLSAAQNVFDAPARDREPARVVRIGTTDPEGFSEDEYAQFGWWVTLALRAAENLFVQNRDGALDHETWLARVNSIMVLLSTPGPLRVWGDSSSNYRSDFQQRVISQLANAKDDESAA